MMQSSSLESTKNQVNEVIGVMQSNIQKVIDRDNQLDDLNQRSVNMSANASQFQVHSKNLKKKYWWKNFKWWLIIILVVIAIILVTVGVSIGTAKDGTPSNTPSDPIEESISSAETTDSPSTPSSTWLDRKK